MDYDHREGRWRWTSDGRLTIGRRVWRVFQRWVFDCFRAIGLPIFPAAAAATESYLQALVCAVTPLKMADLEAVLADVSYLMAMEKSKSTPAARASKKILLPDPR